MITSGKITAKRKVCENCTYVTEVIIFDGKGTHRFYCTRIRGKERDESGHYIDEEMKVSKNKAACNFYKDDWK
jgi:hypothetical protein